MAFLSKTLNATTHLGADLRDLRERAGWSVAQLSHHTKITESFLRALEEEHWEEISDPIYTERILRSLVATLGGQENYFLFKYRACLGERRGERKTEELLPRQKKVRRLDLTVGSRVLAVIGFVVFVLLLGGYVFWQVRAISSPPPLTIDEPAEGAQMSEPRVRVAGHTASEAAVTINGKIAVVQADGSFVMWLDIPRGATTISVSAKKRHGSDSTATRRVVYDQPLPILYEAVTSTR